MAINAQSVFSGGAEAATSSGAEVTRGRQQTVYVNLNTYTLRSINSKLTNIISAIQSDIKDNREEENKQSLLRQQATDTERKERIETNIEKKIDLKVPQIIQRQTTKLSSFLASIGRALTAVFAGWVVNQIVANWDTIEQKVINVYNATRETVVNVSNIIKNVFSVIRSVVDTGITAIKNAFEFVKSAMGTFYSWVESAMNFIQKLVQSAQNLAQGADNATGNVVSNAAKSAVSAAGSALTAADNATGNIASGARDAVVGAGTAVVEGTKNLITGAKDAITGTGTKVISTQGHADTGPGYTIEGQKDAYGRPVVFTKEAAAAFEKMVADSKGVVKSTDIASSQRTKAKNAKEKGSPTSLHLSGMGMDIHGDSKEWIKKNGKRYGWIWAPYGGPRDHGGHFTFQGAVAATPAVKEDKTKTDSNATIKPVESKVGQSLEVKAGTPVKAAAPPSTAAESETPIKAAPASTAAASVTPMMGESAAPQGPRSSDSNDTDFGPYDSGEMDAATIIPQQTQSPATASSIQPVNNANQKVATMESSVPSSETQIVQMPAMGGSAMSNDTGPINAGSMASSGATRFTGARSSNPDNFYVLFSHSVFNVVAI